MRAIEVTAWGSKPVFNPSAKSPVAPTSSDQVQIRILAAGLHHLVRSQAAGKHYSTNPATTPLPYIPGSDGVGITSPEGQLVYFSSISKGGAFADSITLPSSAITPIPAPARSSITGDNDTTTSNKTSDVQKLATRIAALFNPAMSSWMALHTRVTPSVLQRPGGFNILVIGATSLSGQIAIKHARHLGARTIIGLARNMQAMRSLDIDIPVQIDQDDVTATAIAPVLNDPTTKVDVILDYLYGPVTSHVLASLPGDAATANDLAVEYVNIGTLATPEFSLPGALLRSKNITIRGAGPGSWSISKDAAAWFPKLVERLCDGQTFGLEQFSGIVERRLEDVDAAWADTKNRTVFVVDGQS